ncbi:hypothetical protein MW887_009889 [Aspergillus wentii]|nr:hypothetical protein MW887_009889 [Aspergillus wentii]
MRQWGSSLNHNGMSFFLASVPAGTRLYHGSSHRDTLRHIGWMAFDPEHALVFARPPRVPVNVNDAQQPLSQSTENAGWLHTYETTRDIRLVYIDGLSGGKSRIGTLDSQDRILFNDTLPPGGVGLESQRAEAVCRIASEEWNGRIDGVIRMAAGFEIILCAPEDNLAMLEVNKAKMAHQQSRKKPKSGKPGELMRVVTSRYDGIGGDRAVVNYDHFVTAYDSDLDLFAGSTMPRLNHLPLSCLQRIRQRLTEMAMHHKNGHTNWQAIADMTVKQYGRRLRDLVSRFTTIETLSAEISRIWASYRDLDRSNLADEVERCATRFLPGVPKSSIAYRAVYSINERICSDLASVLYEDSFDAAILRLLELMDYLGWSVWKECQDCPDDAFCAIPIWPQGTVEDHEHPRCQPFDSAYDGASDYWGLVWH